jgi:ribosomal protein L16/L10AE
MGPCPECGANRLVPLTFHAARVTANDLERPEVVIMRPLAKCGGCGARIYPDRITHPDDPTESSPRIKSRQLAHAERSGPGERQKHPS